MRARFLLLCLACSGCTTLLGIDEDYELGSTATGGTSSGGAAGSGALGGVGAAGGSGGSSGSGGGTGGSSGSGGSTGGGGGSGGSTGGSGGSGGSTGGSGGSTGGSGGSGGSGGNPGCPTLGSAFPSTPVLDDFNGPDGPVDTSKWLNDVAQFSVASGALKNKVSSVDDVIVWKDVRCADQEAYVTIKQIDLAAEELYLNLKRQTVADGCNTIEILYNPGPAELSIWTCDPTNNWVGYGSVKQALVPGDVLGGRALADGTIQLYVNGVLKLNANASAWVHHAKPGYIGVAWSGPTGAGVLDDFGGG